MAERSLDKFLEEATDASPSYSFQERLAVPASRATCAVCHDTTPVARYSLSSLAPRLTNAILLAERFHLALGKFPDGSSVFTSCDESGKLLKGHAHHNQRVQLSIGQGPVAVGSATHFGMGDLWMKTDYRIGPDHGS